MMLAKSCYTCHHGGKGRSPECEAASTAVCCEEWVAPKEIRVKATVEFEIDLREIAVYYQESIPEVTPKGLDDWFNVMFRQSLSAYLWERLSLKDDVGSPKLFDLTDVEISYESEEEFRSAVESQEKAVTA